MSSTRRDVRAGAWVTLAYVVALGVAVAVGWSLRDAHPLLVVAAADAAATVAVFLFSRAFDNSSFYDPYWSVAPPVIVGYAFVRDGGGDPGRQAMVAAIVGAWAVRLTYNWWRQWRGLGHEDWRYVDLRGKHGRLYWLVSFSGVHFFPTALVYAGCLAVWPVFSVRTPLGLLDGVALALGVFAVWVEATADRQLHAHVSRGAPVEDILDRGVWGWCRNPNYLGELALWYAVALFGTAARPDAWWVWAGPVAMTALFLGISIPMKERRMRARRPAFGEHCRRVPMLLPWPRG